MWGTLTRGAAAFVILGFLMWMLRIVLDPLMEVATSGPNASHSSVQTIASYFAQLTLPNLTLLAGIGTAVYLLGRSVVERQIGGI